MLLLLLSPLQDAVEDKRVLDEGKDMTKKAAFIQRPISQSRQCHVAVAVAVTVTV